MADHPFEGNDVVLPVTEAREHCSDPARSLRRRVALVGTSVGEAVAAAGGWMFDQTMAGWDAYVVAHDLKGALSLRILGARCIDLSAALVDTERGPWPHMLVVSAELYRLDDRIREAVREALNSGLTTVTVWGPDCPVELASRVSPSPYRISSAASAFKPRALAAAGVAPTGDASVELFHTARPATMSLVARS